MTTKIHKTGLYQCTQNKNTMKVKARYVSVWDGRTMLTSDCMYDETTNDVTDIESLDVDGMDLDCLYEEYVELPNGTTVYDFTIEGEER